MRVTIDVDHQFNFLQIQKGIEMFGRFPEIRKSPSGRGYHLIWRNLQISWEESMKYRRLLGDDPRRIMIDKVSRGATQVLFSKKRWIKQ